MSPEQRYQAALDQGFQPDPAQAQAIAALQSVYTQLLASPRKSSWLDNLAGSLTGKPHKNAWPWVKGCYFWGGVGRGKTWLMDIFYDSLPFPEKQRTHFHRFLLDIHARRKAYPEARDPLLLIARDIAASTRVLCFDEFFVSDIADAMILGRLMEALFDRGVTLVTTSNIEPDGLYKDGLKRDNFLPAIAVLKANVSVLNIDSGLDYRLRQLTQVPMYHCPTFPPSFAAWFAHINHDKLEPSPEIHLHDRPIPVLRHGPEAAWFDFAALCDGPRAVADYIELSGLFHTVVLENVPILGLNGEDPARRFIHLVDEFYDRNVKLCLCAAVPLDQLYQGEKLRFEFARTRSRLTEMQSAEYLSLRVHESDVQMAVLT
jgi:cell division protein ZapE